MYPNDMKYDEDWVLGPLKEDGTRDSEKGARAQFKQMFGPMLAPLDAFKEKCDIEKMVIDGTPYGSDWKEITIIRCTPKDLKDAANQPGIIYIHGSAFLFFDAEMFTGTAC
jgi:acetyl esterase/lipase